MVSASCRNLIVIALIKTIIFDPLTCETSTQELSRTFVQLQSPKIQLNNVISTNTIRSSNSSNAGQKVDHFVDGLYLDHCGQNELFGHRKSRSLDYYEDDYPMEWTRVLDFDAAFPEDEDENVRPIASKRIANGYDVKLGQFPSYVKIEFHVGAGFIRICGGTLVSKDIVLTAGHCLNSPHKSIRIIAGVVDHNSEPSQSMQSGSVKRSCIHPKFDKKSNLTGRAHDIGVIQLNKPFDLNRFIQPACLLLNNTHNENGKAYTLGFGQTETSKVSNTLKYMTVHRCGMTRDLTPADVLKNQMVTQHTNTCYKATTKSNVCPGDSGGGVFVMQGNRQYLAATISFKRNKTSSVCSMYDTQEASYIDLYKDKLEVLNLLSNCWSKD